jgi:hypothetical protein
MTKGLGTQNRRPAHGGLDKGSKALVCVRGIAHFLAVLQQAWAKF